MGFKRKVFLIILSGLFIMLSALMLLSQLAYKAGSDSIARQEVLQAFDHATALLGDELKHLEILAADWSDWDDT